MTFPTRWLAGLFLFFSLGLSFSHAAAAQDASAADRATWGVYADLVGHEWRGWYNVSIRWQQPGKEIVEIWTHGEEKGERAGQEAFRITIRPGEKPGRLEASTTRPSYEGQYVGKIGDDGSVSFTRKALLATYPHTVSLTSPGVALFDGVLPDGRMVAHIAQSATEAAANISASKDAWGVYSQMVGKQWLVEFESGRQLLTVDWKVPGEVIYERYDSLVSTSGFSQHVTLDGSGKLLARTNPPYTRVAYGEVAADGTVHFRTKNLFALGQKWVFTPQEGGRVGYHFDTAVNAAQQASMVPVSSPEARALLVAAKKAEQDRIERERIAKSERMAAFDRALMGFSTVVNATAQAYQQASPVVPSAGSMPGPSAVASYPTRPNTLLGSQACAGYTNANFQSYYASHSQGPDAQLHSLCAGAFNYYSMYLNAIRQGYGEADANRTYAAFEDAARVAESHFATAR